MTDLETGAEGVNVAISNLVDGYESMLVSLPGLADKVSEMQSGTETLARRLESKMRDLVDGYEHLDTMSSHLPNEFQRMAEEHRQSLLQVTQLSSQQERSDLQEQSNTLAQLRSELDVLTRERFSANVHSKALIHASKSSSSYGASIYQQQPHASYRPVGMTSSRADGGGSAGPSAELMGGTATTRIRQVHPGAGAHRDASGAAGMPLRGRGGTRVSEAASGMITIPSYRLGEGARITEDQEDDSAGDGRAGGPLRPGYARATASRKAVPSMTTHAYGLPPELQAIKTNPGESTQLLPLHSKDEHARRRKKKTVLSLPVARELRDKLTRN